jgi:predicted O-methyltransferase YrrM
MHIKKILSGILPHNLYEYLKRTYFDILWHINFARYIATIRKHKMPGRRLIHNLIYAWGNNSYSAFSGYIETMIAYGYQTNNLIFECGSGLSTLLLGVIAKERNLEMVSLEHLPSWADRVREKLTRYGLTHNRVLVRPLTSYGDFEWYDTRDLDVDPIGLCICDGPPSTTYGGRKGFLYIFKDKVKKGSVILVDDVDREDERAMVAEWEKLLSFDIDYQGSADAHAVLTVT